MTTLLPRTTNATSAGDRRGTCGHQIRRGDRMRFGFDGAGRAVSVICATCALMAERAKVPTHDASRFTTMEMPAINGLTRTAYIAEASDFGHDAVAAYVTGQRLLRVTIEGGPVAFVQVSINEEVAIFRSTCGDEVHIYND